MGMRMNTAIGYGLDVSKLDLTYFREIRYEDDGQVKEFLRDVENFAFQNNDLKTKLLVHPTAINQNKISEFSDFVIYSEEFGVPNKILLMPPSMADRWMRYNDDIDCSLYETLVRPNDDDWMKPEWKTKPGCLYPFFGLMKKDKKQPLGFTVYNEPLWLDKPNASKKIPVAPTILWFLIKHLKLAPEKSTTDIFLTLRPTFYRWWS